MAILDEVPGIKVTVLVARKKAVEYDATEEERQSLTESSTCPTVTKYIECIDDADFSIKIAASRRYAWGYESHSLGFDVRIDGNRIASRVISSPGDQTINGKIAVCPQSRQLKNYKLTFSAVSTTDDCRKDRVAQDREIAKNLGHIEVIVHRCIILSKRPRIMSHSANHSQKFELAEKSMKGEAISHGTAFSSARTILKPIQYGSALLLEDNGPIAVFRFFYRSKDALQKNLVVPRDAQLSSAQSFDRLSPAEIQRLAKERFEQMQGGKEIKDEAKTTIKRKAVEMIDLSEEDENLTRAKRPAKFIDLTID